MLKNIRNIFNEELPFLREAFFQPTFYILTILCTIIIWQAQPTAMPFIVYLFLPLCLLSAIDLKHMVLPDIITVPLLITGLVLSTFLNDISWQNSAAGAVAGGAFFGAIYWGSYKILGRHGMGLGDIKLLSALGAWVGISGIPLIVIIASVSAIPVFMAYNFINKTRSQPLPFGPFLAIGGLSVWLYQPNMWQFVLEYRTLVSQVLIGE